MEKRAEQSTRLDHEVTKWRRSYKACINCRARKVRCDMGPVDNPHPPPCLRCKRERRNCEFPPSKRRSQAIQIQNYSGIPSTRELKIDTTESQADKNGEPIYTDVIQVHNVDARWKFEINSMQNALEFLAKAAGSAASREHFDATSPKKSVQYFTKHLKEHGESEDCDGQLPESADEIFRTMSSPSVDQRRLQNSSIDKPSTLAAELGQKLIDIEYIGESKLITELEATMLIEGFFLSVHPFYPHIPVQLQNLRELTRYPLLLCAILTVASRYLSFEDLGLFDGDNGVRSITIHDQLWGQCQRLMSQTIWSEASTRSIGTVLAFLLFTEWNPRAIHSTPQNYGDDCNSGTHKGSANCEKEVGQLNGMKSIRNSDRMAWMMTGTAVRLAQDMRFLESNCKIFTATHISEIQTAMNVNQRSILAESLNEMIHSLKDDKIYGAESDEFYLNTILQNKNSVERLKNFLLIIGKSGTTNDKRTLSDTERDFLNDEYTLYYANQKACEEAESGASPIRPPMKFTRSQKAKIELLKIISIGYETIYCDKGRQLLIHDPRSNLALLQILSPLIENWQKNYQELLIPAGNAARCSPKLPKSKKGVYHATQAVDGESLICDYFYCKLYIYSLALQVDVKEDPSKLKEIARSASYVESAYNAAKEILESAERLKCIGLAKYMPIRWVTRMVRAIAFIIKCYLTLTGNGVNNTVASTILRLTVIPVEDTLQMVEKAAITLREASPDELHLGMKYSAIITYFCSEMKFNLPANKGQSSKQHQGQSESQDHWQCATGVRCPNEEESQEQTHGIYSSAPSNSTSTQGASLPNEVKDWFFTSEDIGLEFVDSWTEMIEQKYLESESKAAGV